MAITRMSASSPYARCDLCPSFALIWADRAKHKHVVTQTPPAPTPVPAPVAVPPVSKRRVYAHYFPPYPISLDNLPADRDYYATGYLNSNGEGGKWAKVGGMLRDRPAPRAPLPTGKGDPDWRLDDARTEVTQAKAAGLDGFTVNIMGLDKFDAIVRLAQAAVDVGGFTIVPNLDASSALAQSAPKDIAAKVAPLLALPSAEKVDGEWLISSYAAEAAAAAWWQGILAELRTLGYPTKFIAVFNTASPANMSAYSFAYAYSSWGARTPGTVINSGTAEQVAATMGKEWMAPVAFQDVRAWTSTYAEACNTETWRASWDRARVAGARFVQVVSWDDYSEATHIGVSRDNKTAPCEVTKVYADAHRTGKVAVAKDVVVLTHRTQPYAALGANQPTPMRLVAESGPARDTVEALCILTKAGVVSVNGGPATAVPAQTPTAVPAPLRTGAQTVTVNGKTTTSPFTVTDKPTVQDLSYKAVLV